MNFQSSRFPGKPFALVRINVILGANGSGKSSLLSELRDNVDKASLVYIEGGRTREWGQVHFGVVQAGGSPEKFMRLVPSDLAEEQMGS